MSAASLQAKALAAICALIVPACAAQAQQSAQTQTSKQTKDISAAEWQAAREIHYYGHYEGDTIAFKYGSEETRTMSLDQFVEFAKARLSGHTIVTARDPWLKLARDETADDFWTIDLAYYSPDGSFAFVRTFDRKPMLGKWSVVRATPDQLKVGADRVLACWEGDWHIDDPPPYKPTLVLNGCDSAYRVISLIAGKRQGDVFGLLTGEERKPPSPYFLDPMKPNPWPDGQPLVARKAPHE